MCLSVGAARGCSRTDLLFIANRMDRPRVCGLPLLSGAAPARGIGETRLRLTDDVRIAELGRDIGLRYPADAAAVGLEQLGDTPLQAAAAISARTASLRPKVAAVTDALDGSIWEFVAVMLSEDSGSVSMSIPASASAGLR
jgi:hypothetical protein